MSILIDHRFDRLVTPGLVPLRFADHVTKRKKSGEVNVTELNADERVRKEMWPLKQEPCTSLQIIFVYRKLMCPARASFDRTRSQSGRTKSTKQYEEIKFQRE